MERVWTYKFFAKLLKAHETIKETKCLHMFRKVIICTFSQFIDRCEVPPYHQAHVSALVMLSRVERDLMVA